MDGARSDRVSKLEFLRAAGSEDDLVPDEDDRYARRLRVERLPKLHQEIECFRIGDVVPNDRRCRQLGCEPLEELLDLGTTRATLLVEDDDPRFLPGRGQRESRAE